MKIVFASPTYGPIDPQALKSQRVAIMFAAKHGVEWIGDASPDRMKFDVARDAVVKAALQTEAEGVFWCDSDVILPQDAIARLATADKDFITGIYFQRMGEHYPLIAFYNPNRDSFQWIVKWPENVIAPIDGCGFGCVYTSTAMLRKIVEVYAPEPPFQYRKFSEDFDFARKASEQGYQLYVDTAVICGHLADPVPVTLDTFRAKHDK